MGTTKTISPGIELATGLKSSSIRIKFMFRGMECRESLSLSHTKANINYAVRLRGEILNAIERNTFKYADYFPDSKHVGKFGARPIRLTIGELLREQLDIADKTLAPSTARSYREAYDNHLVKQWDKTPILDLTPALLRAWIGTFTCKIKTMRNHLQPLSNALAQAASDEIIPFNPLEKINLNKIFSKDQRKSEFEVDPFGMAEIAAILEASEGQTRNLWQFCFATGMRPSECMALEWGCVDWLNSQISVERVKVAGKIKEEAKTQAGLRKIDIRQGAQEALRAQQQYTALAGGIIFHDPLDNEPWDTNKAIRQRWVITLRKAGVNYRNPYQTRHTFASTLLSSGENPLYVAKQMGHKNTEMLTRHYGRWIELGSDEKTQQATDKFFAKVSPKFRKKTSNA